MSAGSETALATSITGLTEISFYGRIPGLTDLDRFALVQIPENKDVFRLQSIEDDTVRLLVVTPWLCCEKYDFEIDETVMATLGLERSEDAAVLLVVTPGPALRNSTVNLRAPIVINARNGRAAQVLLTRTDLPIQAPLTDR